MCESIQTSKRSTASEGQIVKVQTNISADEQARLSACLVGDETVAGFISSAITREIARRERGGKVVVAERKPGRPKKPPE